MQELEPEPEPEAAPQHCSQNCPFHKNLLIGVHGECATIQFQKRPSVL